MTIHWLGGWYCFWGFIDGTLNTTCRPIVDQHLFYSRYKQKYGYKYQAIVTPDSLVLSVMRLFIGRRRDWKMVELSGLESKLKAMNVRCRLAWALYLYGNLVYSIVYGIIGLYKNYLGWPKTLAHNQFNKIMSKFKIEMKHEFAIYQNLWTWNSFYWDLKLS